MLTLNQSYTLFCLSSLRQVQRSIDVDTAILHLILYANESADASYVNEKELERYIYDSIPELIGSKGLPESFYPFYVFTSARRFFFYLDKLKAKRLNIRELAHSTVMEEFLFVKRVMQYEKDGDNSVDISSHLQSNWFSGDSARAIYSTYIDLDKDRNGKIYTYFHMLYIHYTAIYRIYGTLYT